MTAVDVAEIVGAEDNEVVEIQSKTMMEKHL